MRSPLIARVALRGDVSRELLWMLPLLGLDPFSAGDADSHLVATFRADPAGALLALRPGALGAAFPHSEMRAENNYVAGALLLSRVLGLEHPYLAADHGGFALLGAAITAVAGRRHILIEGPPGAGKTLLAQLLHRAGGPVHELLRVDCADSHQLAAELRALKATVQGALTRIVLLEHLEALDTAGRRRLTQGLSGARGVRYFATLGAPSKTAALTALLDHFPIRLKLPALRRRPADLAVLARHFLRMTNSALEFSPPALALLSAHPLAGNVRELRDLVIRLELAYRGASEQLIQRDQIADFLAPWRAPRDVPAGAIAAIPSRAAAPACSARPRFSPLSKALPSGPAELPQAPSGPRPTALRLSPSPLRVQRHLRIVR